MKPKLTMQLRKCPVCKIKVYIIAGKFCTHGRGFNWCSGSGLPQRASNNIAEANGAKQ